MDRLLTLAVAGTVLAAMVAAPLLGLAAVTAHQLAVWWAQRRGIDLDDLPARPRRRQEGA